MPLTVVAEFVARTGQEDRLRTALEALIEPTLTEDGCLAFRPYTDPNHTGRMVVIEEWTSPESLAAHFETPHLRHAVGVLDLVLAEPASIRTLVSAR